MIQSNFKERKVSADYSCIFQGNMQNDKASDLIRPERKGDDP